MKSKIILDTNIWVSYFITQRFKELTALIIDNDLLVFTCDMMVAELSEVLSRKKFHSKIQRDVEFYTNLHRNLTFWFPTEKHFSGSPDAKDNFLFDLAIQSKTKLLVTGDKKLLDFRVDELSIISLSEFTAQFKI